MKFVLLFGVGYMKYVGRGNKCVIAYDYVKLTGEKVDRNWAEHQAIGDKIDKLKRIAEELSVANYNSYADE